MGERAERAREKDEKGERAREREWGSKDERESERKATSRGRMRDIEAEKTTH